VVVPAGIDDPGRPSGGNIYDARICRELATAGWQVHAHRVAGRWPWPDATAEDQLAAVVTAIPDGQPVIVDGLIAGVMPAVLVPAAQRVRLVVLVHMPLGDLPAGHERDDAREREGCVLRAAAGIVTTSHWTCDHIRALYPGVSSQIGVAVPGADPAAAAPGTAEGRELLCVGAVAPHKGQDLLLDALADMTHLEWHCVVVGARDRDPSFAERLRHQADTELAGRITFAGIRTGEALARAYAGSDALIVPSRVESYGMVVTEALARGVPVIAAEIGGLPEALGHAPSGARPGLLVPPADVPALRGALTGWLTDADLRRELRQAAGDRRRELPAWSTTARRIGEVVDASLGERHCER
jgi:glycosyltransferase involved in cell wall biosynthesis